MGGGGGGGEGGVRGGSGRVWGGGEGGRGWGGGVRGSGVSGWDGFREDTLFPEFPSVVSELHSQDCFPFPGLKKKGVAWVSTVNQETHVHRLKHLCSQQSHT